MILGSEKKQAWVMRYHGTDAEIGIMAGSYNLMVKLLTFDISL